MNQLKMCDGRICDCDIRFDWQMVYLQLKKMMRVDTVTIAGMGGSLIASILENGKERLQDVKRIIAQPNIHAKAIREWAVSNDWKIMNEQILKEDGKIYEIIVLEKGSYV